MVFPGTARGIDFKRVQELRRAVQESIKILAASLPLLRKDCATTDD